MEKGRRVKIISVFVMIVAVLGLTVVFAAMSKNLNINGIAGTDIASWDVHFANLSSVSLTNKAVETNTPNISSDGLSIENINVSLKEPKDKATYTVDIVNDGSINAEISRIKMPELTKEQEKYLSITATYEDGTDVSVSNIINAGITKAVTISILFKEDIKASDLPKETQEVKIQLELEYVQTDKKSEEDEVITEKAWKFDYSGSEETFTAPYTGYYKLETWGAQGGNAMADGVPQKETGGYGAYSTGIVKLNKGDTLYINVGGKGEDAKDQTAGSTGGYNGGGTGGKDSNGSSGYRGNEPGAGGGGATHIATTTGLLSSLEGKTDTVLMVSGAGGGGSWTNAGGSGGGLFGVNGTYKTLISKGGSQTTGYAFGQGGTGSANQAGGGGGGAGYFGGYGGAGDGYDGSPGAGGSGYIANTNLVSTTSLTKHMTCYNCATSLSGSKYTITTKNVSETPTEDYAKKGNGYAKINYISSSVKIKETTEVIDDNPGDITDGGQYTGTESDPYVINSVEDLVSLSTAVNSGTTYSGKTIILGRDLDINSDSSYVGESSLSTPQSEPKEMSLSNVTSKSKVEQMSFTYDDINGDGTVSSTLKEELTTENGFLPIGNSTNKFQGTFNGNGHKISNLYINRETTDYVGLFGNTTGTIKNLTIDNVNVTGNNYVGGLSGYSNGTFTNITSNTTVKGTTNVGGLSGYSYGTNIKRSNITSMVEGSTNVGGVSGDSGNVYSVQITSTVTGTNYVGGVFGRGNTIKSSIVSSNVSGTSNVGGVTGYNDGGSIQVIFKEGSVTGTSNVGRITGRSAAYSSGTKTNYGIKGTTVNGSEVESKDYTSLNGQTIDTYDEIFKDINLAELVLDTYIGGDNDSDGYYYDYNEKGILVEKNTTDSPLEFTLTGSGNASDPYIVNSADELKQINLKLDKVYKLNADIDLTNESKYYEIGSLLNPFKGTFDGNGHKISNLTLTNEIVSYAGIFGYTTGTIKNLTIDNVNVTGNNYVGGLSGYSNGTFTNITANTTVKGTTNVGGLSGYSYGTNIKRSNITSMVEGSTNVGGVSGDSGNVYSVQITSTVTGTNYVGGVFGRGNTIKSSIVSSNVSGTSNVGGVTGYNDGGSIQVIFKEGSVTGTSNVGRITGRSAAYSSGTKTNYGIKGTTVNGSEVESKDYTSLNGQTIDTYDEIFKDINLAELVLDTYIGGDNDSDGYYYDYNEKGILVEKNTTDSPLEFTLTGSGNASDPYIVNSADELKQINLKLDKVYKLNADIDLTNESKYYMVGSLLNPFKGTFDGNGHSINNLTLTNKNVNYAGIFGYVAGTIKNLTIDNVNVTGNNYVGALVGYGLYSTGTVTNVKVSSSVTGINYVGGVLGNGNTATQIIVKSTVNGNDHVGIISGNINSAKGVILSGSVNGTTNSYRALGQSYVAKNNNILVVSDNVLVNGSTITSTTANSNNGLDVSLDDLTKTKYTELGFIFSASSGSPYWKLENNEMNLYIAE